MNVNIETNTTQQVISAELDELAKNLCGVRLTTADDGVPTVDVDSISVNGVNATSSDGVYGDTKEALAELGVNISANVEKLRVLDPEVLRVLLASKTHANEGYFTVLEFENITSIGNIFLGNTVITEFTELSKTKTTTLAGYVLINCSNLTKIDLENITEIGARTFDGANKLEDVGSLSNLITVGQGGIFSSTLMSNKYNNLSLPNLIRISYSSAPTAFGGDSPALPCSIQYLYCENCLYCGTPGINCRDLKYAFFPSVIEIVKGSTGSTAFNRTTNLKLFSTGAALSVLDISSWLYSNTNKPNASIVCHSISVTDSSTTIIKTSSQPKIGHFFLLPEQANSFSLNANFTSYSDSVLIIGSEDWKTLMLVYATDRGYTLPDEYTDFYYEYIDYMLGDVPVPPAHFKSPEQIKIYTKYGQLSDNDEVCGIDNQIEIILYVDSYRNACTLSLSDNNAGATLNGRILTIPSAANGETVTITATNNYDNTVTASVTIKCYGYMNKAIFSISMANQKIILNKLFKQKMYLTLTDLVTLTAIPNSAFESSALTEADWLLYTNVEIIGENAFYGSLITSVTYPNTIKQLLYRCFHGSKLANISIPSSVIRIGSEVFNNIPWWNNQTEGFKYVDNWLIGYKQVSTRMDNYLRNNYGGQQVLTVYINNDLTTTANRNYISYTVESGTIGIAGSVFANVAIHVTLPTGLKYICDKAMNWYIGDLVLPDSVEYIWDNAFSNDNNLNCTSITFGSGLKYLGKQAFYGCVIAAYNGVTSITLPATLEYIGNSAFSRVWDLGITILATTPPSVSANNDSVFYQGNSQTLQNIPIYVPATSLDAYKEAWASLATNVKNRLQAIPTA